MTDPQLRPDQLDRLRAPCHGQLDLSGRNTADWPEPADSTVHAHLLPRQRPTFTDLTDDEEDDDRW